LHRRFLIGKQIMMINSLLLRHGQRLLRFGAGLLALFVMSSCGREDIRVYTVPKEPETLPPWKLPAGWEERSAEGMRAARFAVPAGSGREADVSIFPLKDVTARRTDIVNIWRQQIRLDPIDEQELGPLTEPVAMGREQGALYDMTSTQPLIDDKTKARILVAVMTKDDTSWFVKMTGDDELVGQQKPFFVAFLQSLNIEAIAAPAQAPPRFTSTNIKAGPRNAAEEKPEWTVPPGWKEQPPSQMLLAKFVITGNDGATADVNISALGGDGGGLLENINRWRRQLSLAPVPEAELQKLVSSLDVPGGKAILVDMNGTDVKTGGPARLIGAIVPREDKTWFYKLMGNEGLAEREKQAFIKFCQSAKYPNG
jgi:hypothetical protein